MKRRFALLLLSVAVALGAWSLVARLDTATLAVDLPPLREAEFAAVEGAEPPGAGVAWLATTLPEDWRRARPGTVEGWYRLRFRAEGDGTSPWAVYLPAVAMNAAVHVNGRKVGDGGRFDEPVARNWNRPLLFAFPARLRAPGENLLHVRVRADRAGGGLLGPVYVGPYGPLRAAHARRYFFKVTALRGIGVLQAVLPLFLGALWMQRRRDTVYGWFAAASLAWSLTWPNLLVVEIPVPTRVWVLLWYLAGGWFILLIVLFALEFIGERSARVNRGLLLYGAGGSTALSALAASGSPWFDAVATLGWITLGYAAGGYAIGRIVAAFWRDPGSFELRVAYLSGLVLAGCGVQDWSILVGLVGREATFYAPYAAPLCQCAMGWILLRRLVGALHRSEALAADLDRRIEDARQDLERSDERIRDVERKSLLAEERERIMREMHDGLGSHLVSTLALVERPDAPAATLGDAVRSALEDIRLIVDSLAPAEGDLLPALGQLRSRLQPRIEAAGLRVEWEVEDLPPIEDLGPHKVLQVLRIVQEAVTNVLRHAGARTIRVRTRSLDGESALAAIFVEVADDGRGMSEPVSPGRGMDNMKLRAQEIGAVLEIHSTSSGTAVRVRMPLRRSE